MIIITLVSLLVSLTLFFSEVHHIHMACTNTNNANLFKDDEIDSSPNMVLA